MKARLPSVGGALLAVVLTAGPLQAQEKDDMHRLVVYNGSARSVQYYGKDPAAARDRAHKENEAACADLVLELRWLYLRNELAMEVKRHQMQMLLYGYTTTYGYSIYPSGVFDGGYRGLYGGWGWGGFGGGYPAGLGTTTHSLQFGIGDEGALKRELMQGLGAPTPEKKP